MTSREKRDWSAREVPEPFSNSDLSGMPTLAIFTVLWLKVLEKAPWKTTIIILVIVMAIVIGVFSLWLGVRFPQGMLYEMIFKR